MLIFGFIAKKANFNYSLVIIDNKLNKSKLKFSVIETL